MTNGGEVGHTITLGLTRKSLEATVIHACPHCEAPGVYKSDKRTFDLWPGCYDLIKHGQPVGNICPNCKKPRRKDLELGELCASMPRSIWLAVLAFKYCLIKSMTLFRT